MKPNRHGSLFFIVLFLLVGVVLTGCAPTRVEIKNYQPQFTAGWGEYKGKSVYLMNFENQASNTSVWYYYSPDSKYRYNGNSFIHNYFWYAFHDALVKMGMRVSKVDNPDPLAPAMWFTLISMTDEQFIVRVTVQKRGITILQEKYAITEPPVPEQERTAVVLEQRAYKMTNRLIETIFGDAVFKKAFAEASS